MSTIIELKDILGKEDINKARKIHGETDYPAKRICDEIVSPQIDAISTKLGQECHSMYLAYLIEHLINVEKEQARSRGAGSRDRTAS